MPSPKRRLLILAGFTVPLFLLCALGLLLQQSRSAQTVSAQWVAHTLEVEARAASLLTLLSNAEAGQRGFLLTENAEYLEPCNTAATEIPRAIEELSRLTADNPPQQMRLQKLLPLISKTMEIMDETLRLARSGKREEAIGIVKSGGGKVIMDSIGKLMKELYGEEVRLLKVREQKLARDANFHAALSWVLVAVGFATGTAILILLRRMQKMQSLVHVCAWSKTVNYDGRWLSFEEYLKLRFHLEVTHSISPTEAEKLLAEHRNHEVAA